MTLTNTEEKKSRKRDTWLELRREIVEYYNGDERLVDTGNPLPFALSKIERLERERVDMLMNFVLFVEDERAAGRANTLYTLAHRYLATPESGGKL